MARARRSGNILIFECPGCGNCHGPQVAGDKGPVWTFNGDLDKPTLSPSILVKGVRSLTDEEADRVMQGEVIKPEPHVCHSFVRDGRIQFLGDCTHHLAGQTVDLPEWDEETKDGA